MPGNGRKDEYGNRSTRNHHTAKTVWRQHLSLSHTVASRELVYQVPIQKRRNRRFILQGQAPNTPFTI